MKIISDFKDYYFGYADDSGPILFLDSKGGPNKREQFKLLEQAGFICPSHGLVGEILGEYFNDKRCKAVVAYTDEQAHCGEGKKVFTYGQLNTNPHMSGIDPYQKEKELYCSAFIGNPYSIPSVSWRRLQIGDHAFWIEYISREDWRSNVGDGENKVIGIDWNSTDNPFPAYPIWAVDFVIADELYAIDFNIAPGIRGSGVEKHLTGRQICDILSEYLTRSQK